MWFIGVSYAPFLSGAPPPKQNPGPAPVMDASKAKSWWKKVLLSSEGTFKASRFDTGEESRRKADPEQVAIDIWEMLEINTTNGCFQ